MHLLIVDDSELVCDMLRMVCEGNGDEVTTCTDVGEVLNSLKNEVPDWILSDLHVPGLDPHAPIATYRNMGLHAPVILISGRPQTELDILAEHVGAHAALSKDLGIPGIAMRLEELFQAGPGVRT